MEAVVVGVRVRPFNEREKNLKATLCIRMNAQTTEIEYKGKDGQNKEFSFAFDASFWSHDGFEEDDNGVNVPKPGSQYADQKIVFDTFGQRVLDNAWDGFHCCLFAYGQTGAGKSYSMVGFDNNKGIVPLSCDEIFHRIDRNTNPDLHFEVTVSMIEIYNEQVQDLLIAMQNRPTGGLEIRESKMLGIYVDGCTKTPVGSYVEIDRVIQNATAQRTIGETLMNATSSRAHTVLTIEFKQVELVGGKESCKLSMINLVDLAGSEKAGQTGASGDRLKEGCAINKSLTNLGNVIEKLSKKSTGKGKKDTVIPYRDSKLTRLLQNALGGSSKTIMICALSPASSNGEETLSTLRYADRAKKIKNVAIVNEDPQDKLLREMKEENLKLKEMMGVFANGGTVDLGEMQAREAELAEAKKALEDMQRSFSDKLQDAREEARGRKKTMIVTGGHDFFDRLPHIVNLNEDPLLNGKVRYCFEEGQTTRIGHPTGEVHDDSSSSALSDSDESEVSTVVEETNLDIVMSGEDIYAKHAIVTHVDGECFLTSRGAAADLTFINGASLNELFTQRETDRLSKSRALQQPALASLPNRRRSSTAWEDTLPEGIVLKHGDRLAFGVRVAIIFIFVLPAEGNANEMLSSHDFTFSQAREELKRGFMKRMRGLGVRAVLPPSPRAGYQMALPLTLSGIDEDDDSGSEKLCAKCKGAVSSGGAQNSDSPRGSVMFPMTIPCSPKANSTAASSAVLQARLEQRDEEVASLRKELAEARAALQGQALSAPLWGRGIGIGELTDDDDATTLALKKLALSSVAKGTLPAAIAGTFEEAVGILDLVQTRLTATHTAKRIL